MPHGRSGDRTPFHVDGVGRTCDLTAECGQSRDSICGATGAVAVGVPIDPCGSWSTGSVMSVRGPLPGAATPSSMVILRLLSKPTSRRSQAATRRHRRSGGCLACVVPRWLASGSRQRTARRPRAFASEGCTCRTRPHTHCRSSRSTGALVTAQDGAAPGGPAQPGARLVAPEHARPTGEAARLRCASHPVAVDGHGARGQRRALAGREEPLAGRST